MERGRPFTLTLALLALLASAVAPALMATADYGPTITDGTSSNAERKVAVAPNGTLYSTFTQPQNNSTSIAVTRSTDGGATWSFLPSPSRGEAFRSCVAVDLEGSLHIAWTEFVGTTRQVFYAHLDAQSQWVGVVQLSDTPGYSGFPSIAVDSKDRVHAVWYGFDGANYQVYYRFLDGAGWRATVQATHGAQDANNPAIAVDSSDQVHVAFYSYFRGQTDVWYMVGGLLGWNNLQRVNPAGVPSSDPSIIVHGDGTPAIAYESGANSTLEVRYAERDASGNWSVNAPVSALGEGGHNPSLVANPYGDAAVFFETAAGDLKYRVWSSRSGSFASEQAVSAPPHSQWVSAAWATYPAAQDERQVNIVWTWQNGTGFEVGSAALTVFGAPPLEPPPPPWRSLVFPLAILGLSAASLAGLWLSSIRTRGGGRG